MRCGSGYPDRMPQDAGPVVFFTKTILCKGFRKIMRQQELTELLKQTKRMQRFENNLSRHWNALSGCPEAEIL